MKARTRLRRRVTDVGLRLLMVACVVIALVPLVSILYTAAVRGGRVLSWHFLTSPEPLPCTQISCQTGGILPLMYGSLMVVGLGALIALPLGILGGIYLSEFGQHRFGRAASFIVDVLSGVPSIIVGLFALALFLYLSPNPEEAISATDAAVALSIVMLPVVVRTTEESLRIVPRSIREGAAALGIPRYRTTLRITLPTGGAGVVTGALLAAARAGGEAAIWLLDAGSNRFGFTAYDQQASGLAPNIYYWGQSGYPNWEADAWGMALILILIMLSLSLTARVILARRARLIAGSG
jgi:phosphate transport system permease protein